MQAALQRGAVTEDVMNCVVKIPVQIICNMAASFFVQMLLSMSGLPA